MSKPEANGRAPLILAALAVIVSLCMAAGYDGNSLCLAGEDSQSTVRKPMSPKKTKKQASRESDQEKDSEADSSDQKSDSNRPSSTEGQDTKETSSEENEEEIAEESDPTIEVDPEGEESQPVDKADEEPNDEEPNDETPEKKKRIIGATATLLEKQSGLLFRARVDTGAKSCSLHIEEMEIVDEEDTMAKNKGKVIRFRIKNGGDETHWLESRIEKYVIVKTSANRERRYKVPITLVWKGVEKKVLVTLNDRNNMEYPLLLGRNFLLGDFLVDVEIGSKD